MRRILTSALIIALLALLALSAGAKVIDMEGRSATVVGRTQFKAKKIGKVKTVSDFSLDFETRTWTGSMEEGELDLSGTFQFLGKGGRKIDISFDAPSFDAVEAYFGDAVEELRLEKKGVDRDLTPDITYYKLTFKLSKNKKKAKLKGNFRVEYTDSETEDMYKGVVKLRLKGVVSRPEQ